MWFVLYPQFCSCFLITLSEAQNPVAFINLQKLLLIPAHICILPSWLCPSSWDVPDSKAKGFHGMELHLMGTNLAQYYLRVLYIHFSFVWILNYTSRMISQNASTTPWWSNSFTPSPPLPWLPPSSFSICLDIFLSLLLSPYLFFSSRFLYLSFSNEEVQIFRWTE